MPVKQLGLSRKQFWAMSLGGKLKCPKCGSIMVEDMALDCSKVIYTCTEEFCEYENIIDLNEDSLREI